MPTINYNPHSCKDWFLFDNNEYKNNLGGNLWKGEKYVNHLHKFNKKMNNYPKAFNLKKTFLFSKVYSYSKEIFKIHSETKSSNY